MPYQFTENNIIGKGGMGCVYRGHDQNGNMVAIKMMSNQVSCYPEYRELFNSEVETLRRMNNPSVVHIVGNPFNDSAGNLYLPMEYVDGKTLEHYIKERGPMSEHDAIALMAQILDAMQYVHSQNCIHRDIKPSNIMLRKDGSICVIDFGIAKDAAVGSTGKTVGRIIGTDGYMSPEQANGLNIDRRTDIYSLGCVLFFILTGKHAVAKKQNSYETIQAILNAQMPLPSQVVKGISPNTDNVFLKAVDKNMMKRFQSAEEFKKALQAETSSADVHHTHLIDIPTVRVGRASDNDIQIHSEYVSGNHLIIRGLETDEGYGTICQLEVEDISSNGSGLNGRRLYHQTVTIDYTSTAMLPQILLAGRGDCQLNWHEVISILKQQGWMAQITTNKTKPADIPQPQPPTPADSSEKLGCVLSILSILAPVVGWVLWAVWKDQRPTQASTAAKCAWIGFIFGLISNAIYTALMLQ